MNQTTNLVRDEFQAWIRERLREEAERREPKAEPRKVAERIRTIAVVSLTMMATLASSIL